MSIMSTKGEKVVLEKRGAGLGFTIRGGVDYVHVPDDPGIFVTSVKQNGAAARDGRLKPGDKILEINGNDLRSILHDQAVSLFHHAGESVVLLVDRGAEDRLMAPQESPSLPISQTSTTTNVRISLTSTATNSSLQNYRQRFWIPTVILIVLLGIPGGYFIFRRLRR